MRHTWALVLFLGVGLVAPPARADDRTAALRHRARQLADEGAALYEKGDYAGALDRLSRANRVVHAPTVALYIARALAKSGRLADAAVAYEEVTRTEPGGADPAVYAKAVRDAASELAELAPQIPTLIIHAGPGVTHVRLDDLPVEPDRLGIPLRMNLGPHRLVGEGAIPATLVLRAGDHPSVSLQALSGPAAGSAPGWRRVAGIVGLAVGGVFVGTGVVAAFEVRRANDRLTPYRMARPLSLDVCAPAATANQPDLQSVCAQGKTFMGLEFGSIPLALVAGAAGGYLLGTSFSSSSRAAASLSVTPRVGFDRTGLDATLQF